MNKGKDVDSMINGMQNNLPNFTIDTIGNLGRSSEKGIEYLGNSAAEVQQGTGIPVTEAGKTEGVDKEQNTSGSKRVQPSECQTCKNRRYQDGSDEMVSFKSPGKIKPEEAYAKVMGHEQEHVSNARAEGSKENKELVSASVTLHTSICPECGRVYISGGTTKTTMRTYNEDAFSQNLKSMEKEAATGDNVDEYA